jgi:hypothetical protein
MKPRLKSLAWMVKHGGGSIMLWGCFFNDRDWETSQDRGKDEQSKIQRRLMKTCSRAHRTSEWVEGSPSIRTTTLSTQPRQHRTGFGTSLWMFLSGPARARTWTCQACSVIPKKTQGCNRCQRCLNKVLSKGSEYLCKCPITNEQKQIKKSVFAVSLWGCVLCCWLMRGENNLINFRLRL